MDATLMEQVNAILGGKLEIGAWDVIILIVLSLPPLFVLFSKRVSGRSRFWWFILTSLFSWLAYVPFLLMTPKPKEGGDAPPKPGA